MARFRKRPIVVEAEQWFPGRTVAGVDWPVQPSVLALMQELGEKIDGDVAVCPTLEGPFIVRPGDWIITGVKGERWPVKPDIFKASYEPVEPVKPEPTPEPWPVLDSECVDTDGCVVDRETGLAI